MNKFSRAAVCAAVIFTMVFMSLAPVAVRAQTSGQSTPKIEFETYKLSNGLTVILHVDRKLPIVHVNQWFHVGSANERPGRTGFAHLFEHMMFQGSKNASRDYLKYVEAAGANLLEGGVNGTTNEDRTNYFATVPSGNLENLLWLESDRLATLTDALTKQNLDNQRDVVKNERRQGLENQPYGRWGKLMSETLFPEGHPYHHDVIGSHEDLTAATEDDVRDFFKTYYTPNNLSLVIAGDFDVEQTKKLVEKYFGTIPAGPALERPVKGIWELDGERVVEVSDRIQLERSYYGFHSPAYFEPGDAELEIAATILTDGLSARLPKALIYDRQLATSVVAFQNGQPLAGSFLMWATARPGVDLSEIEKVIDSEIAKLADEGPTEVELNRAKNKWEFGFVSGLERIGGFGGKADILNQYSTFLGDPGKFDEDVSRHRNVTVQGVKDAVAKYLDTNKRVILRFRPEKGGRPSNVAIDRSKEPALGKDRSFTAPTVERGKLENGLEVLVVSRRELPEVSVSLTTRAGSVNDPSGKEGVASLTNSTMRRGTKTLSALDIDEKMGDLGSSLSGGAGTESGGLGFQVLTRNLDSAMGIMADVALNPDFPQEEIDRQKKNVLDALKQSESNPNAVGGRVASMLAYGKDHPYGKQSSGTENSVPGITRDDLVAFHSKYWKPGSSALIFVGDVSLDDAMAEARKHFGSWSGGSAPAAKIPPADRSAMGKIYMIDKQGAAQTVVIQIIPVPGRDSNDYYALALGNAVYAGGFGTRLNLNLREDKGYSYGVFGFPNHLLESGVLIASGGVQTDKTKESVVEFVKELNGISGEKPITSEELETARLTKVRGYAQQFETLGRIGGQISALWRAGLPMTDLQKEPDELSKLGLQEVNAVMQKYTVPSGTALLLVGDLAKIEQGIRDLNVGEVVILDTKGNPVAR